MEPALSGAAQAFGYARRAQTCLSRAPGVLLRVGASTAARSYGGSSIDVLPVADLVDGNNAPLVVDQIDDAVVALAHTIAIDVAG